MIKSINDLGLDSDVIKRLNLYLESLRLGNDDVYLAAIAKDNAPSFILDKVDKLFNLNKAKMNNILLDIELANRDKYGPRSISKPWSERIESLDEYFNFNDISVPSVKFPVGNLRPISISKCFNKLKNDTNSGLPYFTRKSKVKKIAERDFLKLLSKEYPCILFTRTQESNKTRNVWGYPIADTVSEGLYYFALLDYQKRLNWRSSLIGPDYVDLKISELMLRSFNSGKTLLSIDFSSYDASINPSLTRCAFDYVKSVFQSKYDSDINRICDRFISIPILTPDGIYTGNHGVPSGATFTNEVDSICQWIVASSLGISDNDFQIQGDDGVYMLDLATLDLLKSKFRSLGLLMNEEKSFINEDYCVYLQRLYHKDYMNNGFIGGIYPIYRAINRIVFQERYSNFEDFGLTGIDYYSIRTISILENCKYHPLHEELVKLVYSLDKYGLKFSQKGISRYDAMLNESSGTGGLLYNQFGDKISGIDSFETMKIIKRIRD